MPVEGIHCLSCRESGVTEYKNNSFICPSCGHIFKYADPDRASVELEVASQFFEEGCGNPIKYKCALCGKIVCYGHSEKAKVLLALSLFVKGRIKDIFSKAITPELQEAWSVSCEWAIRKEERTHYVTLSLEEQKTRFGRLQRMPSKIPVITLPCRTFYVG